MKPAELCGFFIGIEQVHLFHLSIRGVYLRDILTPLMMRSEAWVKKCAERRQRKTPALSNEG